MTRYWYISGGVVAKEEVEVVGWKVFWYCHRCGEIYGCAFVLDDHTPWKALGGTCLACEGNRWTIPGSLENIMFVDWKVPIEIARYQLECELRFTRNPDHPWNKEENNANLECVST